MNKTEYAATRKKEMEKIKEISEKYRIPFEEASEKMLKRHLHNCNFHIRQWEMEQAKAYYDRAYAINPNDSGVMWLKDNFYPRTYPVSFSEREYYLEGLILERQEMEDI